MAEGVVRRDWNGTLLKRGKGNWRDGLGKVVNEEDDDDGHF